MYFDIHKQMIMEYIYCIYLLLILLIRDNGNGGGNISYLKQQQLSGDALQNANSILPSCLHII